MRAQLIGWTLSSFASLLGPRLSVRIGCDVEIRPAGSKGMGAFALRDIDEGEFLGRYTGKMMTFDEAYASWAAGRTSGDYFAALQLGRDSPLVVDAENVKTSGWARWVNHSKRKANCKNIELQLPVSPVEQLKLGRIPLGLYLVSSREIRKGEELLVDYGDIYWDSRYRRYDPKRLAIDYL